MITSKLVRVLVLLLVFAAVVRTVTAQNIDELASRGGPIAAQDPLAVELRNQQPDAPARRGFDIGLAASEGQTLWGPGKQKILDSLSLGEKEGFRVAVSFSLERNRNIDLAKVGAAIAKENPIVATSRNAGTDVFYRLGFDIATGIFGDPALGAKGNTETGPGSLKIRDALSAAGQRGFNAAVAFHLKSSVVLGREPSGRAPVGNGSGAVESAAAARVPSIRLPRVPNVVGMKWVEAEAALRQAGFEPSRKHLDEPDPSVPYGHVKATAPAPGMPTADSRVELQIPRAASRMGIGALALSDLERRAGFDIDEGRYEEIFRGADIVLRKYENDRIDPPDGRTYYAGWGLYIEPSDGSVLASLDERLVLPINSDGLGSCFFYDLCERALKKARTNRIEISRPTDGQVTICVFTSKHQMAVVQFRNSDNPIGNVTNFKFHYAIFPSQFLSPGDPLERKPR